MVRCTDILDDFLSAEQYQAACDVIWSTDRRADRLCPSGRMRPGAVVYAKADHYLPLFQALRRHRSRIILVTAESDIEITPEIARLRPPQVARWFSTNATTPSVTPIPLGLGNSYCSVTAKAPALAGVARRALDKEGWLYVNFRTETNPTVREPLMAHFRAMVGERVTVREGGISSAEYLAEMAVHRFVLCPPGNGIDTHRMWEALYCGTIPVVQKHPALASFADLPILFLEDLRTLSVEMLEHAFRAFRETPSSQDKLRATWWQAQFLQAKTEIARSPRLPWLDFLWGVTGLSNCRPNFPDP